MHPSLTIVLCGPRPDGGTDNALSDDVREITIVDGLNLKVSAIRGADGDFIPDHLPSLIPERPSLASDWLLTRLSAAALEDLVPKMASRPDATALRAGLFQIHDYLDESHRDSQSIEGEGLHRCGDYWHAIMHRREPDYSNSKYWFRRVGRHPIFASLAERATSILDRSQSTDAARWKQRLRVADWDPCNFVDLCEHCATGKDFSLHLAARRTQFEEMILLLTATYNDAAGGV